MRTKLVLSSVLAVLLGVVAIQAQAPSGIKRNVLVKDDIAPLPAMTAYVVEAETAPGAESGWHTHPGHTFDYIRSGEAILEVEGKPPQTVRQGMALHIEPGVRHNARNISTTEPFKELVFFVIEQGKPVTIPAPAK